MWRLKAVRHKSSVCVKDLEEFKQKRREHENVLRQARRDRQLVSKRSLLNDEEQEDELMEATCTSLSQDQIREMLHNVQHGGEEKAAHLATLRKALRDPETHPIFTKLGNSMYVLVGQLSGHNAQCQLEAVRCLYELSNSPHPAVGQTCLSATPYLLELCLYTLGNLWPEGAEVKEKLFVQGIVPALANCIQNQRCKLAVMEAAGFTLSQMLQDKDAEKTIHAADASSLITAGLLSQCSNLLITLGGAVAKGSTDDGMELLIWPLLRCLGNMLASGVCEAAGCSAGVEDVRLLAALCVFSQTYLTAHCALSRESLWVLNNLTAGSPVFCSAVLFLKLVPDLLQLLPFSHGINTMVLRVLGNVAHNGPAYGIQLAQAGLLPVLCSTLKMADPDIVTLSLEVLHLLMANSPQCCLILMQVAEEFIRLDGIPLLEAIQYNNEEEQRLRASYILDSYLHFHPDSDPTNPSLHSQFVKLNEAYRVLSKEATRKEYDLQMRYQSFAASSRSTYNPSTAGTTHNVRYWEQFRNTQDYSEKVWQKKRKTNLKLVGYCIVAMLLSVGTHYFGFRKLEELHNDFMDKKDSVITKIYNESKERARVNGLKKQQEILRQQHAEFLERYKIRQSGKEK
ncbi:Transmembrane and coiled-coil domain-containing protein 6 [Bagarius yarrelli]|uniref:Transmembrane and coiled-coil domain-containing protein 6 n=1 Tax=Bagarius yarrelli TaxID=175774 RepID=A0A556V7P2_BAGYA|nr:Transmembrane and coiled-coil domain-containing protein 6 [Bagarius yarrelli]